MAGRVLPWVVMLPLSTAFYASTPSSLDWVPFSIMFVFILAVCSAVVSLGVAMLAWCRRGAWAVVMMTAVWGVVNAGWITIGNVGFRHRYDQSSTSGDPFFDVVTLNLWLNGVSASDFRALAWVLGASIVYAAGGGALMLVTLARRAPATNN